MCECIQKIEQDMKDKYSAISVSMDAKHSGSSTFLVRIEEPTNKHTAFPSNQITRKLISRKWAYCPFCGEKLGDRQLQR